MDVFNLTYIRRKAEIEARKKKEQEPKTWWGSVSNWWGGNTPKDDPSLYFDRLFSLIKYSYYLDLSLEDVMTPEEKKKLDDAIGYEGDDKSTSTYPETVNHFN